MSHTEERLSALGIALPRVGKAVGNYTTAVTIGHLVFLSGQGPVVEGKVAYEGAVGAGLTLEDGRKAARLVGLNLLAALQAEIGSLDRVRRVAKVLGWVCSAPDFTRQPAVIDGLSDLLVEVLGDRGVHARSAVSSHVLPLGMAVEAEMVVEIA